MNILGITRTNSGVDYHRIYNPLRYLPMTSKDIVIFLNENSKYSTEFFEKADILYLNRHLPLFPISQLAEIKNTYNLKLVVDLDDYWNLYKGHLIYEGWNRGNMPTRITESLKLADLVTTTHERLANEIKRFNERVEILPNAVPMGHEQFIYNPIPGEYFNVIYAGGNSHFHDLKSIGNLFRRIGSDGNFKRKARMVLAGYHNPNGDKRNVWHHIEGIVNKAGSYDKIGVKPVTEYMAMYDIANLAIAPLENNHFNTFKSNLKTIEAGCKHIPIVATNIHPYTLDQGVQGVTLCNSIAEWYKAIMYYVNNPNAAKDDGDALFEYVNENYNLTKINKTRYEFLNSLL